MPKFNLSKLSQIKPPRQVAPPQQIDPPQPATLPPQQQVDPPQPTTSPQPVAPMRIDKFIKGQLIAYLMRSYQDFARISAMEEGFEKEEEAIEPFPPEHDSPEMRAWFADYVKKQFTPQVAKGEMVAATLNDYIAATVGPEYVTGTIQAVPMEARPAEQQAAEQQAAEQQAAEQQPVANVHASLFTSNYTQDESSNFRQLAKKWINMGTGWATGIIKYMSDENKYAFFQMFPDYIPADAAGEKDEALAKIQEIYSRHSGPKSGLKFSAEVFADPALREKLDPILDQLVSEPEPQVAESIEESDWASAVQKFLTPIEQYVARKSSGSGRGERQFGNKSDVPQTRTENGQGPELTEKQRQRAIARKEEMSEEDKQALANTILDLNGDGVAITQEITADLSDFWRRQYISGAAATGGFSLNADWLEVMGNIAKRELPILLQAKNQQIQGKTQGDEEAGVHRGRHFEYVNPSMSRQKLVATEVAPNVYGNIKLSDLVAPDAMIEEGKRLLQIKQQVLTHKERYDQAAPEQKENEARTIASIVLGNINPAAVSEKDVLRTQATLEGGEVAMRIFEIEITKDWKNGQNPLIADLKQKYPRQDKTTLDEMAKTDPRKARDYRTVAALNMQKKFQTPKFKMPARMATALPYLYRLRQKDPAKYTSSVARDFFSLSGTLKVLRDPSKGRPVEWVIKTVKDKKTKKQVPRDIDPKTGLPMARVSTDSLHGSGGSLANLGDESVFGTALYYDLMDVTPEPDVFDRLADAGVIIADPPLPETEVDPTGKFVKDRRQRKGKSRGYEVTASAHQKKMAIAIYQNYRRVCDKLVSMRASFLKIAGQSRDIDSMIVELNTNTRSKIKMILAS